MTQIKIGDRVITRKFEDAIPGQSSYFDKEGTIEAIRPVGFWVHGHYWPPSAVEPISPPFQPEYGKEYEFSQQSNFASYRICKFIAKDGDIFVGKSQVDRCYYGTPFIRPIRKGLEDEIREACQNNVRADKILSIIAKHRTEPTDEEIKEFWHSLNLRQSILDSVVETVRHFLSKQ